MTKRTSKLEASWRRAFSVAAYLAAGTRSR